MAYTQIPARGQVDIALSETDIKPRINYQKKPKLRKLAT